MGWGGGEQVGGGGEMEQTHHIMPQKHSKYLVSLHLLTIALCNSVNIFIMALVFLSKGVVIH